MNDQSSMHGVGINVLTGLAVLFGTLDAQRIAVAARYTRVALSGVANLRIRNLNPLFAHGHFVTGFGLPFQIARRGNNAWGSGLGIGEIY